MFANLELTERQDYNPDEFCFAWKDMDGMPVNVSIQQDAQEFLNFFFDRIETALKPTPFRYVVEDVYGGKICNMTICSNCKVVNERLETFYPLSLEIKGFKNIHESLGKFIQGEVISDYQCDACKQKADVTKSCLISKVPNYMIIHLQRICFNYEKFENEKINSRLEFPLELNVYNYTVDKQKGQGNPEEYQFVLKGINLHYGSAEFGHYFSYIKESENKWI
jgi:ubiquitin carboxyl-terminal hydrolase 34